MLGGDQKKENGKRRKEEVQNTTKKTKDKKVFCSIYYVQTEAQILFVCQIHQVIIQIDM